MGLVDRPEKIVIKGLDRNGDMQEYALEGFEAIVMCHEFDHLEGVLYKDKAKEMYELTDVKYREVMNENRLYGDAGFRCAVP